MLTMRQLCDPEEDVYAVADAILNICNLSKNVDAIVSMKKMDLYLTTS